MVTRQTLLEYVHARRLRPFRISMAAGRELLVPHPDFNAIASGGRYASVFLPNNEHHIISLRLITGLAAQPDTSAPLGDG